MALTPAVISAVSYSSPLTYVTTTLSLAALAKHWSDNVKDSLFNKIPTSTKERTTVVF